MSTRDAECFFVPDITPQEHTALQALHVGAANEYEQRLALKVIVNKFARANDVLFIPGAADEGTFLSGRAFVGQKILKYLNMPVGRLRPDEENNNEKV